jgi:hypothetical protein
MAMLAGFPGQAATPHRGDEDLHQRDPGHRHRIGALPERPVRLEDAMLLRDGYQGAAVGTESRD